MATEGRYHTKIETHLKIEKKTGATNEKGEYWTVIDMSGTVYRFGANLDSENILTTSDPAVMPGVWRWSLDRIKDANGNCIYYSYTEDQGAVYPSRIEYNNDRQRMIEFVLEDRPDPYQSVDQGSEISVAKRLSRINVSVSGSLVKSFKLDYAPLTTEITQSLLTSITKQGSDGSSLPPTTFAYKPYPVAAGQEWLLEKVTEDLGGTSTAAYTSAATYPNTQLPFDYWVVSAITRDNGLPIENPQHTTATTGFAYDQGLYDTTSNEFRGFGQVTETRPDGGKVVHTYHQDDAKKGKEAQTVVTDVAGNLYASSVNSWSASAANGVYTVNLDNVEAFTYDGKADNPKQTLTEYTYDAYGNVTQEARSGDVALSGDELITVSEYVYNQASWIVDKVKHVYSAATSGGPHMRESWFNYDGHTDLDTPPVAGNLTREEAFLDTGENPVTIHEYDIYGNRVKTIDAEKRVTTVTYDSLLHTFPVEVTNALKQTTVREFNPANGQPTMVKDANGFVTTFKYDAFNRLSKEIKLGDSETYPSSEIIYFLDGTAPESVKIAKREKSGTSNTLDAFQFVDGLGRLIQTKTEYKNSVNRVALDVFYDAMGRDYKHSSPYLTDPATDYSTPLSVAATVTEYDPLGRPVKTTNPDSTFATTVYDHWTVTSTDENGHSKTRSYDANKNLVQVIETNHVGVNGSDLISIDEAYTTDYQYNTLGELRQTRNHYGNIVSYLYDTLGRKVTAIDPDQGRKDYVYDLVGNLSQQTDARGVVTKFQYDPLNRTLQVIYPKDTSVKYTYDLETIGTLTTVTDALGTVSYKYDNRLRKTREDRNMDGITWTSKWDYDALNRVISQTYPDTNAVSFTYNTMGKLDGIPSILSSIDYNERGQETLRNYANGLGTVFDYNPLNQHLTNITTAGIQDFTYGYDKAGNVQSIANASDATNKRTETFTYDDLDRLVNAEDPGSSGYKNSYAYNAIGNMLVETDVKNGVTSVAQYTYGLGGAGPHAVTGKSDTRPVIGTFSLNGGTAYSSTQTVTLDSIAMGYPTEYLASENADFANAAWQTYSTNPAFNLTSSFGPKTVYFKVRNANGETAVVSRDIQYLLDSSGTGIPDVYNPDLDNNGIPDAWEKANGVYMTMLVDPDNDGLTNLREHQHGTNPNMADSDSDGWNDSEEISLGTNPNSNGFDNVRDGSSVNYSLRLGKFNQGGGGRASSSYQVNDTLGKAIALYDLVDTDGDGIPDIIGPDADNNGIPDTWERAYGIDVTVPGHAQLDPDHDGLTNLQEYRRGTNPNKTDTDGDGLGDYAEAYVYHSDPNALNTFQPVGSENYSLVRAAFNMGGSNRSGDTTLIVDRIGSQLSSTVLLSNSNVAVIPTMIDFGVVDANGKTSQITLNNLGSGSVTFGVITVEGENGLEFTTQNDVCSNQTIAPSDSCTVSVSFMPAFSGSKGGLLLIPTDDPLMPGLTVNLSGIAVTLTDSLPPSGSLVINSGANLTKTRAVELTLSVTDASGVSQMCISNTSVCENWETFAMKKSWLLTEGDDVKSLFVWFRDNPGNANLTPFSGAITLDTTKPIAAASLKGGVYAVGQTITLTSNEPGPIYYSKDGRNPTTASQLYSGAIAVGSNSAIKFYSVDPAGNQGEVKSEVYVITTPSVIIDTTAPTVTDFTLPPTANSLTVTVTSLTSTDDVAVAGYLLTESATAPLAAAIGWSASTPTSYTFSTSGSKTLYAWAKDAAGNVSSPLTANMTITLPVNGACGSSNDDTFTVIPATNLCTTGSATAVTGSGPWTWNCIGTNSGSTATCSANLADTTSPTLTLSTLSNGAITNNGTLNISGTTIDSGGIKSLTVNSQTVSVAGDGSFTYPVTLVGGANTLTTVATDNAGNQTTDTRTVTLDISAPTLTVTVPADNYLTGQGTVTVNGVVSETATVQARVGTGAWQTALIDGTNFSILLSLSSGQNTIEVTASDAAGNSVVTTSKRTVTYDATAPTLAVTNPNQDITTAASNLTLSGTVSDTESGVTVNISHDGQNFIPPVTIGSFSQALNFTAVKTYPVVVNAVDAVGNASANITRNVIYAPYIVNFIAGSGGSISGTASQTISEGGSTTAVTAVPTTGYHFINWTGTGGFVTTSINPLTLSNVTASITSTANFTINSTDGACGAANGTTVTTTPTSNLCTAGTASTVTGSDSLSWTCAGLNGGTNAACTAIFQKNGVVVPSPGKTGPDITDALRVLNISAGKITPTAADYAQGDIAPLDSSGKPKGNGVIDTYDVIGLLRMVAGLL